MALHRSSAAPQGLRRHRPAGLWDVPAVDLAMRDMTATSCAWAPSRAAATAEVRPIAAATALAATIRDGVMGAHELVSGLVGLAAAGLPVRHLPRRRPLPSVHFDSGASATTANRAYCSTGRIRSGAVPRWHRDDNGCSACRVVGAASTTIAPAIARATGAAPAPR